MKPGYFDSSQLDDLHRGHILSDESGPPACGAHEGRRVLSRSFLFHRADHLKSADLSRNLIAESVKILIKYLQEQESLMTIHRPINREPVPGKQRFAVAKSFLNDRWITQETIGNNAKFPTGPKHLT